MNRPPHSSRATHFGRTNPMILFAILGLAIVGGLSILLWYMTRPAAPGGGGDARSLFVYCAAGMRYPMEAIAADYEREMGVKIQLQYGGSNALLSQLKVSKSGDLYLAGDESYIALARKENLLDEAVPLAHMKPVIAVKKDNDTIHTIDDLLKENVKVALGEPDSAAIGKVVRKLLTASGQWDALNAHVTAKGTFTGTVNEIANAVKIGSVQAGITWDSTVAQYPELKAISTPELDKGSALIEIGVLRSTTDATAALRFARYVGARDKGLPVFKEKGFDIVEGDKWEKTPQMTFFAGSVNRGALDPIISTFEKREGARITVVYNGCGILTAQMKVFKSTNDLDKFPDSYMACDVYYLDTVQDMFEPGVMVSDTDIVLVTQKGNPKNIKTLADMAKPGVRVVLGHGEQCTIGVLSQRLLESEGVMQKVAPNIVSTTATSALLVPNITTKSADAILAYRTDTRAERDKLEVIDIDSPLAKAVQPFSTSLSSDHKQLSRRLLDTIARSKASFENAGFNWRLPSEPSAP